MAGVVGVKGGAGAWGQCGQKGPETREVLGFLSLTAGRIVTPFGRSHIP